MGAKGCLVITDKETELVEWPQVAVVDTTAAGDSFNGGYLAARMAGKMPQQAASAGHALASVMIQHRGAIIPSAVMPRENKSKQLTIDSGPARSVKLLAPFCASTWVFW